MKHLNFIKAQRLVVYGSSFWWGCIPGVLQDAKHLFKKTRKKL